MAQHHRHDATISGCVLVRDEAELLRGCLESMAPFVNEMVVVDNGSTDGSPEAARELGARVISEPGKDLDQGRTAYLEAATSDWILVLDADERICNQGGTTMRRIAAEAPGDLVGWNLPCLHYSGQGRWSQGPRFRLWRNDPRIRYSDSPIHASAGSAARAIGRIERAHVPIHHLSGFYKRADRAKSERYIALMADNAGRNPIFHTYIGLELTLLNRHDEAEAAFGRGVREAGGGWGEYELVARLFLASFLLRRGRLSEAQIETKTVCAAGPDFHRWDAAQCVAAEISWRQSDRAGALEHCRVVLKQIPESPQMRLNAAALLEETDPVEALTHLREAIRLNPYLMNPLIYSEPLSRQSVHMHVTLLSCVRDVFSHAAACCRALGDEREALRWERRGRLSIDA